MKVLVVNLARSPERLARVSARLAELGVEWERLEAVDDSLLPAEERAKVFSPFGWWCCTLMPPVRGQLGCALSHRKIFLRMVSEDIPAVCVLEDDVVLDDRFPQVLAWVDEHLDVARSQVALLSDHDVGGGRGATALPGGSRLALRSLGEGGSCATEPEPHFEPCFWDWCSEGYVVTLPAAKAMLKDNSPLRVMNDTWERWANQGVIELCHVRPTVCSQRSAEHPEESEINRLPRVCEMPLTKRIAWKCKRVVGVTLDALSSPRRFRGRWVQTLRKLGLY